MKITIDIPDQHINDALAAPHSIYWTTECEWDPETQSGYVIDNEADDGPARYELTPEKLQAALVYLATGYPRTIAGLIAGEFDGPMGDELLQAIAFGSVVYG